ncbi:hypothetical protein JI721_14780 [Alicyclobacillus cycloheptanicus]|uniref:Beta-lactamase n=1 Tax=Alicyclobacillus cycloheptanicus TaxID=1457 RepID=A0ABT9XD22_9BACL|nr:hypothetical protein [Alicyclobacillus cycloheptanicus]MDQ0188199.1 hypothetical protein [Alicyclobacillus cycloheptanicus]WDM00930.1 hypothetical protein JI721_14780 [Alicyclobacillus cycloheptanicus]
MAVLIGFGGIKIAAQTNNAGVWFGQNMQNGWDAHSVTKLASAFVMGDFNLTSSMFSVYLDPDLIDAPILDQDLKGNANLNVQGV